VLLKEKIGVLFEPVLFGVFLLSAAMIFCKPSYRRDFIKLRKDTHHSNRSFILLLRMTSKSVAREVPLLVPSLIAVGGIMGGGASLAKAGTLDGAMMLSGVIMALGFLVFIPLMFPLPSSFINTQSC